MSTVIPFDPTRLTQEALTWPEKARAIVVTSDASYVTAGELLKGIKALRCRIAETFDPHIQRAHAAHKALLKEKADAEAPLTQAESILKVALVTYQREQERQRAAEEALLRELARQQEEARRLEEAVALEAEGYAAEAVAVLDEPITAPAIILPSATPKVAGISYREVWRFRIVDAAKLPREYTKPDDVKIGGVVRALKGNANIPGVEVYVEKVAAAGK